MSSQQIQPTDETLPALDLPAGALPTSHPDYRHNVETDPPEIEPIEHRLRVDFIEGGPLSPHPLHGPHQPRPRRYADRTLTDICRAEQRYYATFPDKDTLADAPAFLRNELAPNYRNLREAQQRRLKWYTEHIPNNLDQILDTVESLYPNAPGKSFHDVNGWVGIVIVSDGTSTDTYASEHGLDEMYVVHESDLDDYASPSEYGISFPAPLLAGEYNSRSRYSLIPWSDGLVCGCPYKQKRPSRCMCKHELAATIRLAEEDQYILPVDAGVTVPQRARRFVSPTIAAKHTPRLPRTDHDS
jgi:hypothetical protein